MSRTSIPTQIYPRIVERAASTLPQTDTTSYFTVTGKVLITQIIGEATTGMEAIANNMLLISNPTAGNSVNLCAAINTNAHIPGTLYNITGTFGNAMQGVDGEGALIAQVTPVIVREGVIELASDASATGEIKWTVHWMPLDAGSSLTVA